MNSGLCAGCIGLALAVLMVTTANAQETIFDPENPGIYDDEEESEAPDEAGVDEPSPPAPAQQGPSGFRDTQWSTDYRLAVLADPPFGPAGEDAVEFIGGLGMGLRHDLSEQTRAVVEGRFSYWAGAGQEFDNWRTLYEPRLARAYIVHRRDRWSWSAGQMRNSWGSTDLIRPGDVIDPVDMRDPLAGGGAGEAIAQLSASAAYRRQGWTLRALVVPFFEGNRMNLFGRDPSLVHERNPLVAEQLPFLLLAQRLINPSLQQEIQPFLQATDRPQALPKNASGGVRATKTVSGTDLGAGAFFGWDRTPAVVMDEDLREVMVLLAEDGQIFEDYNFVGFIQRNPEAAGHMQALGEKAAEGETIFASRFQRRVTLLVDGARYLGPLGVRGDVAFSPRRTFYTEEFQPVRRAVVHSALGVSYERLLDGTRPLAVTVEGFWMHPFGVNSPIHRAFVPDHEGGEEEDRLLLVEDGYYGFAAGTNWQSAWWDLELSGGAVVSVQPGDVIARLSLARAWRPGVKTTLGASIFAGPNPEETLSPGGIWAQASRVYLMVSGEL